GPYVSFMVNSISIGVAAGDFNRDGSPDLVAGSNANDVSVLLNGCNVACTQPGFGLYQNYPSGPNPQALAVADFNRDGNADVAAANFCAASASVMLGDGNGGFGAPQSFTVGDGPVGLAAGDFNRD